MATQNEITIAAANVYGSKYDEAAKALFLNPEIVAPILQAVIPEYKNCSIKEVISLIEKDSMESDPVDNMSKLAVDELPTEMNSLGEKVIRYDAHFKARNPVLSDQKMSVMLHIDLEVQNDYKPSNPRYPLVKRAIYYGAREISSQLGILTKETNYASLEKVYSIWICNENIPESLRNTVTSYSVKKQDEIGRTDEPDSDYDLLTVVIIRRGSKENDSELFEYLNGIFDGNRETIGRYVDLDSNEAVREGVDKMTGLGESLLLKGRQEGKLEGRQEGKLEGTLLTLLSLVDDKILTLSEAAKRAGMSEEEFASYDYDREEDTYEHE